MKDVRTICFVAVVLFLCACPALGVLELKDGLTHNIDDDFTESIWVDYRSPGMYTTVNVLSGTEGGDYLLMAFENSRINMSTSGIYSAYIHWVYSFDSSQVNISGGYISRLNIYGSSHVDISGGEIGEYLEIGFYGILDISGGWIAGINPRNASQVNISGGIIAGLVPEDNSTIRIFGSDFAVNGQPVGYGELTGFGQLTGTLASGEPINNWFHIYDDARIILIPEPATVLLLGLGGLLLRKRHNRR